MKKEYEVPMIEAIDLETEKAFATSGESELEDLYMEEW